MTAVSDLCPCQSGVSYGGCCFVFLTGVASPETPDQLMRSRYTAYVNGCIDYIERTMTGPALKNFVPKHALDWAKRVTWNGLKVLSTSINGDKGWVSFDALYLDGGRQYRLKERSEFVRINGRWLYFDRK